jgi:hypothetical protein
MLSLRLLGSMQIELDGRMLVVSSRKSRALHGLVCRLSTRILAYNLCFVMGSYLAQLSK